MFECVTGDVMVDDTTAIVLNNPVIRTFRVFPEIPFLP